MALKRIIEEPRFGQSAGAKWTNASGSRLVYPCTLQSDNVTLFAWVYQGNAISTNDDHNIIQVGDSTSANSYYRLAKSESGATRYLAASTFNSWKAAQSAAGTAVGDRWQAVGATFEGTSMRELFVDGRWKAWDTSSHGTAADYSSIDYFSIGYENDATPGDSWDGSINWACVWNARLEQGEMVALAHGRHPMTIRPHALRGAVELISSSQYRNWARPQDPPDAVVALSESIAQNYTPVEPLVDYVPIYASAGGGGGGIAPIWHHYSKNLC